MACQWVLLSISLIICVIILISASERKLFVKQEAVLLRDSLQPPLTLPILFFNDFISLLREKRG